MGAVAHATPRAKDIRTNERILTARLKAYTECRERWEKKKRSETNVKLGR
jgi:hypothetical protein